MYLPVPSQPDCATAWRQAVRLVDSAPGHEAYNVVIDVANPTINKAGCPAVGARRLKACLHVVS
jgi:hypothetical protein